MKNRILVTLIIVVICSVIWSLAIEIYRDRRLDSSDTLTDSKATSNKKHAAIISESESKNSSISLAEQFTFESSQDFSTLKLQYEAAASAGDPYARRVLAKIYEYCAAFSLSPEKFSRYIETLKSIRPESSAQLDTVYSDVEKRCSKLDGRMPITNDLVSFGWAQAVAARDPVATLMVAARQANLDAIHLDQLIDRALPSADPDTLFEIGTLIGAKPISVKYAEFSDPYLGRYAWQVLACRRGGERVCGTRSPRMTMMCLNGICSGMNFEQSVIASLPAADQARLRKLISKLESSLYGRSEQLP